jgi:hypothetical protein
MTVTRKGLASDNPHRSGPRGLIRVVAPLETDLSRSKWILHPLTHKREKVEKVRTDTRTGRGQVICPADR